MLYRIAGLLTEIPMTGNMDLYCREYLSEQKGEASIVVDASRYNAARWPGLDPKDLAYMESGLQFYSRLPDFDGFLLHASCLVSAGKAVLFSGNCGYGKSTHARLWQQLETGAEIINDDKPALRLVDGVWTAYGTPWCGREHRNINAAAPVAALVFLTAERSKNSLRRLSPWEALARLLDGSVYTLSAERMERLLGLLDSFLRNIPVFELESLADEEAILLVQSALKDSESNSTKLEDRKNGGPA